MDKIKISYHELTDPKIDELLAQEEEEAALRRGVGAATGEVSRTRFIYQSWFNLMLAGFVGAFIAWALFEPHFHDNLSMRAQQGFIGLFMISSVGGLAGLMIGCMEGILARNFPRGLMGGLIGLGVGFGGGLVSAVCAGIVYIIVALVGIGMLGRDMGLLAEFMLNVIARTLAWTVFGMTVGLGPGIALKSKKMVLNGFIGGMLGGSLGGLLFDPIGAVVSWSNLVQGGEVSRAIGFSMIGAMAGLMIGLVEMFTKDAWLLMTAGPLAGKQFIVYKNPTLIGSSPKCEVYLFKDLAIEPFHAAIHTIRDGYELEDKDTAAGTLVNGHPIKRKRLANGDLIQIGEARFIYSERDKKRS